MKALVLGCGSIGYRHISHLLQLGIKAVEAADPDEDACSRVRTGFGIWATCDPDEALQREPDVVLVCTPAQLHLELALRSLETGAHVFIEKPISTTLEGLEELLRVADSSKQIVQVGYNLRYHPAMKTIKRMLDDGMVGDVLTAHVEFGLYLAKWWPGRDYRGSYMADADLGGGLLLDASHEIDAVLWYLGPARDVAAFGGKLSRLEIGGVDSIKVIMNMESEAIASLHIDCLKPTYTRVHELVGEGSRIVWDCPEGRADTSLGRLIWFDRESDTYKPVKLNGNPEETYLAELADLLQSVETGQPPLVGVREGVEVLKVTKAIQQSIKSGEVVKV